MKDIINPITSLIINMGWTVEDLTNYSVCIRKEFDSIIKKGEVKRREPINIFLHLDRKGELIWERKSIQRKDKNPLSHTICGDPYRGVNNQIHTADAIAVLIATGLDTKIKDGIENAVKENSDGYSGTAALSELKNRTHIIYEKAVRRAMSYGR